jgi:hypothetical protein
MGASSHPPAVWHRAQPPQEAEARHCTSRLMGDNRRPLRVLVADDTHFSASVGLAVLRARGAMGRLRIISVVTMAALVAGCTRTWVRAGADAADLDRDKFECQFEASKTIASSATDAAVAETRRNELESLCMVAKGWSRSWGR